MYEDEDDENAESNWRNDYPDEEDSDNECGEERYGGEWDLGKKIILFITICK